MTQRERIRQRAARAVRSGRAGEAIRLHMLAAELKTMRFGPPAEHEPQR